MSFSESEWTERREVRSSCSGWKEMRLFKAVLRFFVWTLRCCCNRSRVSLLFFSSRVVYIRHNDCDVGRVNRNSSTSRQQMAKPRPLRREVSASSNEREATSLTCLHPSRVHSSDVPHQENDFHDCPLLSVKRYDFIISPSYFFFSLNAATESPPTSVSIGRTIHFTKSSILHISTLGGSVYNLLNCIKLSLIARIIVAYFFSTTQVLIQSVLSYSFPIWLFGICTI